MKKTELESIKNIAKIFLNFEPKKDEQFPFVIDHPFTNSPYVNINGNLINIIESKYNFDDYITLMNKEINEIQDVIKIYYLIQKPYSSAFLKYTYQYLNNNDLADVLKQHWQKNEFVNIDTNISKLKYVSLFKKCKKENLMDENELNIYNNLPTIVKVYRGINNVTKHPIDGLSWTIDKEQAIWFAKRFDKGGILCETEIEKEHILAYFDYEKETVIDIHFLKNIIQTKIN